jgi:folate-dependent phosphoribosylglycinamide formyltransferase PurN
MDPIYSGKQPMQVVAFGSGSCTTIQELLRAEKRSRRMNGGIPEFELRAFFTDKKKGAANLERILEGQGIDPRERPIIRLNPKEVRKETGTEFGTDEDKIAYDAKAVQVLKEHAASHRFSIDLIALAGYMRLIRKPLLDTWGGRIINSHPARLAQLNGQGDRLYTGDDAVYDAIMAGEISTASSIHVVTEGVDAGPILITSAPLDIDVEYRHLVLDSCDVIDKLVATTRLRNHYDRQQVPQEARDWFDTTGGPEVALRSLMMHHFADQHQELQKRVCDYPAYIAALTMIARGELAVADNKVYLISPPAIQFMELPYGGIQL